MTTTTLAQTSRDNDTIYRPVFTTRQLAEFMHKGVTVTQMIEAGLATRDQALRARQAFMRDVAKVLGSRQ